MTQRVADFRDYLTHCINEHREKPFEWGKHDCALWIANCVEAITGEDFAKPVRGKYKSAEGAYKAIVKYYKVNNLKELMRSLFGEEQHIAFARPGDIVYRNSNYEGFDIALGICNGPISYFINIYEGEGGLVGINTLELDGSFRVA